MTNSTRHTAGATTLDRFPAVGTFFDASVAKILAVYFAVTILAERYSVANIEPQIGIISPRLDMMCVNVSAALAAILAGMGVSRIYSDSPLLQLWREACPFTFKRFTIFPRACQWAGSVFSSASARTIAGTPMRSGEDIAAIGAGALHWWVAVRPAGFRAIARIGLAWSSFVGYAAHFANFNNSALCGHCLSRWIRIRTASDRLGDIALSAVTSSGDNVSVIRSVAPIVVGRPAPVRLPPRLDFLSILFDQVRCEAEADALFADYDNFGFALLGQVGIVAHQFGGVAVDVDVCHCFGLS